VRKNQNSSSIYIDDATVNLLKLHVNSEVRPVSIFDTLIICAGKLAKAYLQRNESAATWAILTAATALEIYLDNDEKSAIEGEARILLAFDELKSEIMRARTKFPDNKFLLAALMEEIGELFEVTDKLETFFGPRFLRTRSEALQVACVAVRIYEETDATFDDITEAQAKL